MSDILPTIATLGVLFISTLARSTLGFGDALVAMPFLIIVLGPRTATPLVALVATLISAVILIRNWQIIAYRSPKFGGKSQIALSSRDECDTAYHHGARRRHSAAA
ncbi:MAG TPA: hypothetical protein VLK82_14725 [Candidatus Tectomicrobia bacterium]|nr:hypothetical protein [Candidatus Tectomicrobia bacterium]